MKGGGSVKTFEKFMEITRDITEPEDLICTETGPYGAILHKDIVDVAIESIAGAGGIIRLPDRKNNRWGYPANVTKISAKVFAGNTNVTDIVIPCHLSEIPEYAFSGCASLRRMTIPKSMSSI